MKQIREVVLLLPREVKQVREVVPRGVKLPSGGKFPREVALPREPTLPREVLGSKHDESSHLTRFNRDRQLSEEVYVDMASSLVFSWFPSVIV